MFPLEASRHLLTLLKALDKAKAHVCEIMQNNYTSLNIFSPQSLKGSSECHELKKNKRNKLCCKSIFDESDYNVTINGPHHSASSLLSSFSLLVSSNQSTDVPDLTDSTSFSDSSEYPITPTKAPYNLFADLGELSSLDNLLNQCYDSENFNYSLKKGSDFLCHEQISSVQPMSIFEIPELVYKIVYFADLQTADSVVDSYQKTKAHFTTKDAKQNWSVLSSCMLVNKLFHEVTKDIISERLRFNKQDNFEKFVSCDQNSLASMRPKSFTLNRLYHAKQSSLETISRYLDPSRLQSINFFLCPKLAPPLAFFTSSLTSLTVAGSRVVDDSLIIDLSQRCHKLQTLDLRACDYVTDAGIYAIASNCVNLTRINLGRKKRCQLITDNSVSILLRNNPHLETVGLAGCAISDISMWELAISCGASLKRLSVNGCYLLSDESISQILVHDLVPKLSVLEIRDVPRITDFSLIVTFKRHQALKGILVWIETSDFATAQIKECERAIDLRISKLIRQDLSEWINGKDEDLLYSDFLMMRAANQSPNFL